MKKVDNNTHFNKAQANQREFTSKMKADGFTLVELLMVIALVAISVGVTSDILLSLIRSYNKTTVITEIEQEANFIGLVLEKELRNATSVSVPNGNNGNRLSFEDTSGTTYYNVSGSNLYRSGAGWSTASTDALVATPSIGQTVGGVNLECDGSCFSVTGTNPQIVTISMTFKAAAGGGISFKGEIHLKNTIVLRNTY